MVRDQDDKPDRDKLSWRERDALKNKSRHVHEDRQPLQKSSVQKRGEALAKKALEDLFQPKKNKEQEEDWKKVSALSGREFEKKAEAYIEKHGMPKVWDDLMRLLDADHSDLLLQTLSAIESGLERENPGRLEVALAKMSILKITQEDPKVLKKIESLSALLNHAIESK